MPERVNRARIIAGPNGSGKSTLFQKLSQNFDCGIYLNTDEIEKVLREKNYLNLADYHIETDNAAYEDFLNHDSVLSLIHKAAYEGVEINLTFKDNIFLNPAETNSYEAALIAGFIRQLLLIKGATFTFETVMSHPSKLDFLKTCEAAGYRVYLYFISTESVEINIERVQQRVAKKGHAVAEDKIRTRFNNCLNQLQETIPLTYRTFLFDNSSVQNPLQLIGEISNRGTKLKIEADYIPDWVAVQVLEPLGFL